MAPAFPPELVSRVKEETDIVDAIRGYVSLVPSGAGFKALCPFHREKTPSFYVTPDRQIFKCFGCGEGGDVISFLMKIEGISFPEALETLARPLDIDLSSYLREDDSEGERLAFHRANEAAATIWQRALWDDSLGRSARLYLQDRGFGEDILRRYEVGYAPRSTDWFQRALQGEGVSEALALGSGLLRKGERGTPFAYFRNRIIFPIKNIAQRIAGFGGRVFDQGEPKYLNSADSAFFSKGKLLYGFAASRISISRLKTAILVEGYLDLLAMAQAGFSNVVATCGTAFTPEQAGQIRRGSRTLVFLFDGDRPGLQAAVRACHVALGEGIEPKVARLPKGEDPASLLSSRAPEDLTEILAQARGYLPFLFSLVAERGEERQLKERALRQALKSLATVQDPIRQEYLLQEAAQLFGIGLDILRGQLAEMQLKQRHRTIRETLAPAVPSGSGAGDTSQKVGHGKVRDFARINRPAIEATMLAHVLRDRSGRAAAALLNGGGGLSYSTAEAELLVTELDLWRTTVTGGRKVAPVDFVQERWNAQGAAYRQYVSGLLTKEVVPEQTDFARVIQDCLARLFVDQQRRQS